MTEHRSVEIEGKLYTVTISDEREALLAAAAAGRALVELLHTGAWTDAGIQAQEEGEPDRAASWPLALYGIENLEDADDTFLERVVRRKEGIPWRIAETERLLIREFQCGDAESVPKEMGDSGADRIFCDPEQLSEYIQCQYRLYEFGIWAVAEKESGRLVGKAGFAPAGEKLELGYHIFEPFRRRGYAAEAVEAVLSYAEEYFPDREIEAKTDASNEASAHILTKFGFQLIGKKCSGSDPHRYRFVRS